MGIRDWLRRLFSKADTHDTVPFYDFEAGAAVQIPRRELSSKAIQIQIQGMKGLFWVLPDQLQQGDIKHEPFSEDVRDTLRHIQTAFSEHDDLTLDEWEDGFRRDTTPERQIALWSHAADVYLHFTTDEPSSDRRADVYRCIVNCITTGPDTVWDVLHLQALDKSEAKKIVDCFFGVGS